MANPRGGWEPYMTNKQVGKLLPPSSCYQHRHPRCNVWDNLRRTFWWSALKRYFLPPSLISGTLTDANEGNAAQTLAEMLYVVRPLLCHHVSYEHLWNSSNRMLVSLKQGGLAYMPKHRKNVLLHVRETLQLKEQSAVFTTFCMAPKYPSLASCNSSMCSYCIHGFGRVPNLILLFRGFIFKHSRCSRWVSWAWSGTSRLHKNTAALVLKTWRICAGFTFIS